VVSREIEPCVITELRLFQERLIYQDCRCWFTEQSVVDVRNPERHMFVPTVRGVCRW